MIGMVGAGLGYTGWKALTDPPVVRQEQWAFQLPHWDGDSYEPMHRIRDGHAPHVTAHLKPSKKVPLVIIGGGLSALTLAYAMRDTEFLLLERECHLGGNAKSGEYKGIRYAKGSAYLVDTAEPYGPLYNEIGLDLSPVGKPDDMMLNPTIHTWQGLEDSPVGNDFHALKHHLRHLVKHNQLPPVPIQQATHQHMALDTMSFARYLTRLGMSDEMQGIINAYCFSALGGSIQTISAYAGLNFYSEILSPLIAFPGGNAMVAKKLIDRIHQAGAGRMETNVTVFNIEPKDESALVHYWDNNHPDHITTVQANAVAMCTPYKIIPRIISTLPATIAKPLLAMQYGAYIVANCCFEGRPMPQGYDHWTADNPAFTDFILADACLPETSRSEHHSVLTVYAPCQQPAVQRHQLLSDQHRQDWAFGIAQQLHKTMDFSPKQLKAVRLTRYGHQLLTSSVGLIHQLRAMPKHEGPLVLAHSDGQGMASIESAITEALAAVPWIKQRLGSVVVSRHMPELAWGGKH